MKNVAGAQDDAGSHAEVLRCGGRGVSWGLTRRGGRGGGRGAPPVDSALRAREPAYGNFLLLEGGGYRMPRGGEAGKPPFHGLRSVPWSITNPYSSAPRTSGTRWWLSEERDRRNYKGSTESRSSGGP